MEKKMENEMDLGLHYRDGILGFYRDKGKDNGNYYYIVSQ